MKRQILFDPTAPTGTGAGMAALDNGSPTPAPATPSPTPVTTPGVVKSEPKPPAVATPPSGTPPAPPSGAAPTGSAQTPPATLVEPQTPPATVPQPGMSAEQVAALVKTVVGSVQQQQQPAAPAPTAEDFNKTFNVYQPTAQDVTDILAGGDQGVAALNRIIPGAVKQALTMAAYAFEQRIAKLQEQYDFDNIKSDYQQRKTEKLKSDFFTKNPDLKPQEQLVIAVAAQLRQEGFQGTNEEAFAEVAKRAKAVLSQAGVTIPSAGTSAGQGQQPPVAGGTPPTTMPSLSMGGQGGAGGSPQGGTSSKKSPGLAALE